MDKNELLDSLAQYGYPLMKPSVAARPEEVLEYLLKQKETRLLEGFPAVFARILQEKKSLEWESRGWNPNRKLSKGSKEQLAQLLALSYFLFKLFALGKNFEERTLKLLFKFNKGKQWLAQSEASFATLETVKIGSLKLSLERMKNNFRNYFSYTSEEAEVQKKKQALELELLLSELFTPRQKELLRKRLEGKAFTKTEREYFYRVVKKRLKALANAELHQLARALVFK